MTKRQAAPIAHSGVDNPLRGLKVLVVDDHQISAEIIEDMLLSSGLRVEKITNSKDVITTLLAAMPEDPFAFIILDYIMPGMTGVDVAFMIGETPELKDVLVILGTSQPTRSDAEAINEAGIKGYLVKPVRQDELLQIMGILWDGKKNNRDLEMITRYSIRDGAINDSAKNLYYKDVTILVADDNVINQEVMSAILNGYGISTVIAENGHEAVERVRDRKFDLIFMDCQMPEMDGFLATRIIRKSGYSSDEVIVIALTANAMKGDKEKCLAAGMNDYLAKPVIEESVEVMLQKWLPESKRSEKSNEALIPKEIMTMETTTLDIEKLEKLKTLTKEKFPKIILTFISSSENLLNNIDEALRQSDMEAVREHAHALKAAGQLGADHLFELARNMEEDARSGTTARIGQLLADARSEFNKVKSELESLNLS